jgi:CheY-like chemotaxis protein
MARILLVDDHPEMREVLTRMLKWHRHDVISCESGEDAMQFLAREIPDATIVDDRMPGVSGLEIVRLVRQDPRLTGMVIIVCSADSACAIPAREAGADGFWLKGSDNIFDLIDRLTGKLS